MNIDTAQRHLAYIASQQAHRRWVKWAIMEPIKIGDTVAQVQPAKAWEQVRLLPPGSNRWHWLSHRVVATVKDQEAVVVVVYMCTRRSMAPHENVTERPPSHPSDTGDHCPACCTLMEYRHRGLNAP